MKLTIGPLSIELRWRKRGIVPDLSPDSHGHSTGADVELLRSAYETMALDRDRLAQRIAEPTPADVAYNPGAYVLKNGRIVRLMR